MNYKALLEKYIAHVGECEGVSFMPRYPNDDSPVPFTEEEVDELHRLDKSSYDKWTSQWDKHR